MIVFSFARIGAALALKVDDYVPEGKRWMLRLHDSTAGSAAVGAIAMDWCIRFAHFALTAPNTPDRRACV